MTAKVWAFSESPPAANEAAAAASGLAGSSGGTFVVVGLDVGTGLAGEEKLILKSTKPLAPSPEAAAEALARAAKEGVPDLVLIGSTRNGKEIASRLAVKLGWPCVSDVFGLSLADRSLHGKRNVFAGKLLAEVAVSFPCVATLKVGSYPGLPPSSAAGTTKDVGDIATKTRVVDRQEKKRGTVDLKGAKLIVSAGRGVKKKEDLALIGDLASELGGAVGCSRPLSSDMGWLPEEHHIGLTGVSVHPDLYLAVGISGQLQHVAGIKDSKVIAAVNNDKSAPIFEASDYGVVGDLYAVVPALLKELKARHH
jgi:electron transfer flavoprotein alpha subunit